MKVSVIVSTYTEKRLDDITYCFESLEKQTLKPSQILLVLDPKPELIKFYESRAPEYVETVISPENGLSNARNAGIEASTGEILVFIDDDAYADPYWLEKLVKNYEDPNIMSVGGLLKPHWETEQPTWLPLAFYWTIGCSYQDLDKKREVRNPIGANMSFRKIVFEKVGLFRSDIGRVGMTLLAGEEAEFSLKVVTQIPNSKIIYDPSAIVYHRVPQSRLSLRYLINRAYFEGISKGLISKSKKTPPKALSSEQGYLKHILLEFIPSKLKTFYTKDSASQIALSIILMISVFIGFIKALIS